MARKILLADDSVTAQNMGRKILADAGYEVITVNNGSAALKKISEVKPDLVILDVYMPGYSGLEVCQRLKETPDSSRIPVLLTVGKLEPFKPEEAQRVRADAFIIKPFEASELLSALSKLEDKVVPRSESSKPGRFARAIASVEASSRGQIEPIDGGDENGWKNRISFPHEKTEPEEKIADDASIYNPVNRDLRTVVATPAERVEEKKDESKRLQEMAVEDSVDVAAVAPVGVPQDVTPEEVAAIAAAAAQIQALQATLNEEEAFAGNESASATVADVAPAPEARIEAAQPDSPGTNQDEASHDAADVPMTMAAAAGAGASRWTAVSVALDADEANLSLEQEMQRAYAALVAEQSISVEAPAVGIETQVEQGSAAAVSVPEAQPQPEWQPQVESPTVTEVHQEEPAAAVQPASFAPSEPVVVPEAPSATAQTEPGYSMASVDGVAAETPSGAILSSSDEPAPAEVAEPTPVASESTPVATVEAEQEISSVAQAEAGQSEAADSEHPFTSFGPHTPLAAMQEQHPEDSHSAESTQDDADSVKSSAAAWASWRQIRDANEPKPAAAEAPPQEPAISAEASVEAAAMAVAAGAEQLVQEAPQPGPENPADVASIVDSVLADLRPRLMAEISRKMAEKK